MPCFIFHVSIWGQFQDSVMLPVWCVRGFRPPLCVPIPGPRPVILLVPGRLCAISSGNRKPAHVVDCLKTNRRANPNTHTPTRTKHNKHKGPRQMKSPQVGATWPSGLEGGWGYVGAIGRWLSLYCLLPPNMFECSLLLLILLEYCVLPLNMFEDYWLPQKMFERCLTLLKLLITVGSD